MRPRLVRLSEGDPAEIPVGATGLTLGRDASNVVRIDDPAVSSRHCVIDAEDGRYVLLDRDSTNGTFVNGKAVTRAYLEHGDEIRIGYTLFRFVTGDDSGRARFVRFEGPDDTIMLSTETVRLNPSESAYLKGVFGEDAASLKRVTNDISVLLRLSTEINEIGDSGTLQEVLLERLFEIVPAESGVVLLGSSEDQLFSGEPVSRHKDDAGARMSISRSTVQQVFASGEAILRNALLADEGLTESIVASRSSSILCVPLSVKGTRIGVLYLDTTDPARPFDERHLELASAIAGIAALALEHARYVEWLEGENRQLAHEVNVQHEMVGDSARMRAVYEAIYRVAPTDSPVLILGESGTGKELAARAIHNNSSRRSGPFIVMNCGAVAESLFVSALFGHVKGAFTGADRDHKGVLEEADGGTLFLDELGELPLHCQAALLRVLEDGRVQRVGSARSIEVDVRLISATNRSLKDEIHTGGFRADLYFRMGLPLTMPPLRERLEDIPQLVRFFIGKYRHYAQREIGPTPPDTIRALQEYDWPGNVRELGHAVQWAVVFGKSDRIRPEDLPEKVRKKEPASRSQVGRLDEAIKSFERQFILRALEETRGNVVEAAALLVRAPNYLQRRISQLQLRDELDRIRGQA